jgi:hypothetical protein
MEEHEVLDAEFVDEDFAQLGCLFEPEYSFDDEYGILEEVEF